MQRVGQSDTAKFGYISGVLITVFWNSGFIINCLVERLEPFGAWTHWNPLYK